MTIHEFTWEKMIVDEMTGQNDYNWDTLGQSDYRWADLIKMNKDYMP